MDELTNPVTAAPADLPEPTDEQYEAAAQAIATRSFGTVKIEAEIGSDAVALCGGAEAFLARNDREKRILEKLAKALEGHGVSGWNELRLKRAAKLHLLSVSLGGLDRWERLELSHFRAVFGLPTETQRELLDAALANRWSATLLIAKAMQVRNRPTKPKSAAPTAHVKKHLRQLADAVDDYDDLSADLVQLGVAPEEIAALVQAMSSLAERIKAMEERVTSPQAA